MDQSDHQPEMPGELGKNGQSPSRSDLCESIEMLIPAYGIGIADADERAFVEANLADCPDAATQLAEYRLLHQALLHSAPLVQPPMNLEKKLAEAVQKKTGTKVVQDLAASSVNTSSPRLQRQHFLYAVAAILVIALVSLNIYWIFQNNQLRDTQQQILAKLNDQQMLFRQFGAGTTRRVELTAVNTTSAGVRPYAAILCDPNGQRGLLYVKNFPALPSNEAYQLWMRLDGKPISLGVFKVDGDGSATVVFWTPKTISAFDTAGVTTEPSNGSPSPTGSPVVRGELKY